MNVVTKDPLNVETVSEDCVKGGEITYFLNAKEVSVNSQTRPKYFLNESGTIEIIEEQKIEEEGYEKDPVMRDDFNKGLRDLKNKKAVEIVGMKAERLVDGISYTTELILLDSSQQVTSIYMKGHEQATIALSRTLSQNL
ncbi:Hypothetical protein CINCED_3A001490 [Cinara cedri]|uniref:Uncharacterized protein n=1 Tax=Cinara cedri TaxID=506608 RepID=A0A5E4NJI2_9HEMI|nr:Hypothetical protein CINCED_3A001490 [Cinara cedri]